MTTRIGTLTGRPERKTRGKKSGWAWTGHLGENRDLENLGLGEERPRCWSGNRPEKEVGQEVTKRSKKKKRRYSRREIRSQKYFAHYLKSEALQRIDSGRETRKSAVRDQIFKQR